MTEYKLKIIFTGCTVGPNIKALAEKIQEVLQARGMRTDFDGEDGHLPFMDVLAEGAYRNDPELFSEALDEILRDEHVGYPEGRSLREGKTMMNQYRIFPDGADKNAIFIQCDTFSAPFRGA